MRHRLTAFSFILMPMILASSAPAQEITSVRSRSDAGFTEVVIATSGHFEFKVDQLINPDRVFFDFAGVRPAAELKRLPRRPVDDSLVRQFRVGTTAAGSTRIVFDLARPVDYVVNRLTEPDQVVVQFRPRSSPLISDVRKREAQPTNTDAKPISPSFVSRPVTSTTASLARGFALNVSRIVIDPGHGGEDSGAIGRGGLREKDVTLDVSLRLLALLRSRTKAEAFLTRSEDVLVSLQERTAFANSMNADIFLSIHANSSPSRAGSGTETYYLSLTASDAALDLAASENAQGGKTVGELKQLIESISRNEKIVESRSLAQFVEETLFAQASKLNSQTQERGVKRAPFLVLIGAAMPAALAEIGFINNSRDEFNLRTPEYREIIAEALYRGLTAYSQSISPTKTTSSQRGPSGETQNVVYSSTSRTAKNSLVVASNDLEWRGIRWRVPIADCVAHDAALTEIPEGFELPGDDELSDLIRGLRLSASRNLRSVMPFWLRPNSTVWTNHLQPISDRWNVVRLSDGEVLSQVPDSCAYVLVKQSTVK